jgi:predicted chitinase
MSSHEIYTVKDGDTLWAIAKRFWVSHEAIQKLNQELNPNLIYPKQTIKIPRILKNTITGTIKKSLQKVREDVENNDWEDKIIANLEKWQPFMTRLGTFDLRKKFTPGEAVNVRIITDHFNRYLQSHKNTWNDRQKKTMLAYVLATAKHETMNFSTLVEKTDGKKYNPPKRVAKILWNEPGEGPIYIGRGYVQITGENNYQKWSRMFFWDKYPTILTKYRSVLLLNPDAAATILIKGMIEWHFTGKGLTSYLIADGLDFEAARRTVNGTDKAREIAQHARNYLKNGNVVKKR